MLRQSLILTVALTAGLVVVSPGATAMAAVQATPAIAHRSTSSNAIAGPATTLLIAKPAGTVAGDVLIAHVASRDNVTTTMTPPAGWQVVKQKASLGVLQSWTFSHAVTATGDRILAAPQKHPAWSGSSTSDTTNIVQSLTLRPAVRRSFTGTRSRPARRARRREHPQADRHSRG